VHAATQPGQYQGKPSIYRALHLEYHPHALLIRACGGEFAGRQRLRLGQGFAFRHTVKELQKNQDIHNSRNPDQRHTDPRYKTPARLSLQKPQYTQSYPGQNPAQKK
jgi:hypothetical protein